MIILLSSGNHLIFHQHSRNTEVFGRARAQPLLQEHNSTQMVTGNEVQG